MPETATDTHADYHLQDAFVRGGASLTMWVFALAAFLFGMIEARHLLGISVAVGFLVVMGFPVVVVAKRITRRRTYRCLLVLVSTAEALGYTSVMYFLGGVEASYLLPVYVTLVSYVGVVEHRESPFVTAAICGLAFALMLVLEITRVLPPQRVYAGFVLPWPNQLMVALAISAFLFVAAYMSAFAARSIKRAKRLLTEQNAQLELRVEERTAELRREVEDRKAAEERIGASLEEKELLLREIHHRVKNNLQVVSSLLSLQSGATRDPATTEILAESQNRVRSMALIHEKLYQSEGLERVDFADYVRSLITGLLWTYRSTAGGVTFTVAADDVSLGIDRAIPCGLIVNELFSNALKHAFPAGRSGAIEVSLRAEHEPPGEPSIVLTIRDDGVGLPDDLDIRKTGSLGLQLVGTLSRQIGGVFEVGTGPGTTFSIRFPKERK
jgi:two-component sensor histidine kinase